MPATPITPTKTTTTNMSTTVPAVPLKKAGPPVPPRPSHAGSGAHAAAAGLLKTQQRNGRDSVMNAASTTIQNRIVTTTTTGTSTSSAAATLSSSDRVSVETAETQQHNLQHPIIQKKPTSLSSSVGTGAGGRTVVYKSPSMSAPKRPEASSPTVVTTSATTSNCRAGISGIGPKPPLKLRKAPDIPTMKPKTTTTTPIQNEPTTPTVDKEVGSVTKVPGSSNSVLIGKSPPPPLPTTANSSSSVVIVQTTPSAVNLSRHHSMGSGSPKTQTQASSLKDTRLSLGRVDFERVGKIQLDQLPTSVQPLPRPRKLSKCLLPRSI
ncbi:unnamed protein product [Ceratitis capitata]|uniref:(Mediterranean fruit fly) hypothetical protein n=1 Tax=Ceratitis capitata TaxID=7213 RepID=A0A811U3R8_CERCA|nr:unnamed protein product [Ceratitis capitata]